VPTATQRCGAIRSICYFSCAAPLDCRIGSRYARQNRLEAVAAAVQRGCVVGGLQPQARPATRNAHGHDHEQARMAPCQHRRPPLGRRMQPTAGNPSLPSCAPSVTPSYPSATWPAPVVLLDALHVAWRRRARQLPNLPSALAAGPPVGKPAG